VTTDYLGAIQPAPRRRRAIDLPVLLTGAAALAVAATGTAVAVSLSGGGTQPEDVLPAGAIGFAKVDLDPSAEQKLALFELGERFPATAEALTSEDSLRDDALRLLVESGFGVDYDADVAPWIGDRVGAVALPSGGEEPDVVVAVAHDDREAAQAALERAAGDDELGYAFVDGGYVLLAETQAIADEAAASEDHLADEDAFADAVGELEGGQLAVVWTDVARVWDALPAEVREQAAATPGAKDLDPTGTVVLGVRAETDAVELTGLARDVVSGLEEQQALAVEDGTGLAAELPQDALVAVSVSGLGAALGRGYDDLVDTLEDLAPDVESTVEELGLDLPEDLETLLGEETAVGVWGSEDDPRFLVRTRSDDPGAALDVLERAFEATGGAESGEDLSDYARERDGGLVVGTPDEVADDDAARLGDLDAFRDAVPDADDAAFLLFVDVAGSLRATGVEAPDGVDEIRAVGATASGSGADADLRLRIVFR
jgi:hypothetical protein